MTKIINLMELVGLNAEHATRYAHEFSVDSARVSVLQGRWQRIPNSLSVMKRSVRLTFPFRRRLLICLKNCRRSGRCISVYRPRPVGSASYFRQNCVKLCIWEESWRLRDSNELNEESDPSLYPVALSAVPYPDPKWQGESYRIVLEGDVPACCDMPSGCAFRTRCKYATEQVKERPPLTDRGDGHQAVCWNSITAGTAALPYPAVSIRIL